MDCFKQLDGFSARKDSALRIVAQACFAYRACYVDGAGKLVMRHTLKADLGFETSPAQLLGNWIQTTADVINRMIAMIGPGLGHEHHFVCHKSITQLTTCIRPHGKLRLRLERRRSCMHQVQRKKHP